MARQMLLQIFYFGIYTPQQRSRNKEVIMPKSGDVHIDLEFCPQVRSTALVSDESLHRVGRVTHATTSFVSVEFVDASWRVCVSFESKIDDSR